MSARPLALVLLALALGAADGVSPARLNGQVTAADSAAVLLETARTFEAEDRWDVAEALYRLVTQRYGTTPSAAEARARLVSPPDEVVYGSGRVELQVWMTLYGAWLGVALPGALGADSPEPYGAGLLLGAPSGFLAGRALAGSLELTEGQARAVTLGGSWGTWQGFGWREVLDLGVRQICDRDPFNGRGFCYDSEESSEETFAAMIVGGLVGVAGGALLSGRDITPGTGTAVNFGSLWGTWIGFAGGYLLDLEDDDLLASTLIGGNTGLAATAVLAPGWNMSRSRARLISISGVLGGLGGAGFDLLLQPDSDKAAMAIPLVGSVLGLAIGAVATRPERGTSVGALDAGGDAAVLTLRNGKLGLGTPVPLPMLVPADGPGRARWRPALGLEVFRASF